MPFLRQTRGHLMLASQIIDLSGFTNFPRRLVEDYVRIVLEDSNIRVRSLTPDDFEGAKKVEAEAWGENLAQFSREQFLSRVTKFPDGNIGAVKDGRLVGLINTQRVDYDFNNPFPTWNHATADGFLRHNPQGTHLYGVNLSIDRHALLSGVGNLLMLRIGGLMLEQNIAGILLGVRPLGYHRFSHRMTFEEYLYDPDGRVRDPELNMYGRMGFHIKLCLPDYFDDHESGNYGVLLMMENPHYKEN
jgi:hypothetical protein